MCFHADGETPTADREKGHLLLLCRVLVVLVSVFHSLELAFARAACVQSMAFVLWALEHTGQ